MRTLNRFAPLKEMLRSTAAALLSLVASTATADQLTIVLTNIEKAEGSLMVQVGPQASFEAGEGEQPAPMPMQIVLPAQIGEVQFTTDALPGGTYAVQAFHDVNGNGDMDSNFVGMPKEPWGFSNNARGNFGPPKFADTKFELSGSAELQIELKR